MSQKQFSLFSGVSTSGVSTSGVSTDTTIYGFHAAERTLDHGLLECILFL